MSFILEALKKSEKKRQDGTVPKLEAAHQAGGQPPSKKANLAWSLLAVLVLNAVVLLWLFGPWQQPQRISAPTVPPPSGLDPPDEEKQVQHIESIVAVPEPAPSPLLLPEVATIPPVKKGTAVPAKVGPIAVIQVQPVAKIASPSIINAVAKPVPGSDQAVLLRKVSPLAGLPLDIRREIPELHMSVHAFYRNEPATNLVRINDQIMREGARLNGKFLLEEITADGAIFAYAGYRFLVPRKNRRTE